MYTFLRTRTQQVRINEPGMQGGAEKEHDREKEECEVRFANNSLPPRASNRLLREGEGWTARRSPTAQTHRGSDRPKAAGGQGEREESIKATVPIACRCRRKHAGHRTDRTLEGSRAIDRAAHTHTHAYTQTHTHTHTHTHYKESRGEQRRGILKFERGGFAISFPPLFSHSSLPSAASTAGKTAHCGSAAATNH